MGAGGHQWWLLSSRTQVELKEAESLRTARERTASEPHNDARRCGWRAKIALGQRSAAERRARGDFLDVRKGAHAVAADLANRRGKLAAASQRHERQHRAQRAAQAPQRERTRWAAQSRVLRSSTQRRWEARGNEEAARVHRQAATEATEWARWEASAAALRQAMRARWRPKLSARVIRTQPRPREPSEREMRRVVTERFFHLRGGEGLRFRAFSAPG